MLVFDAVFVFNDPFIICQLPVDGQLRNQTTLRYARSPAFALESGCCFAARHAAILGDSGMRTAALRGDANASLVLPRFPELWQPRSWLPESGQGNR
jgi:hypothetical protein